MNDINKEEKTNVLILIPNDLLKKIEDYQFDNRISNRSEAIRELIKKGLEKI